MILQILADAGERSPDSNAEPYQFGGIADAGQHQESWRIDRTQRQNDFDGGAGLNLLAINEMTDRDTASAFETKFCYQRMRQHSEIVTIQHGPEIAPRRAETFSRAYIEIGWCYAFVGRAIRIVDHGNAEFGGAVDQRRRDRMKCAASFDPQRTACSAPFARTTFPILAPLEIRQHILEGPALCARSLPGIIVRGMAAIPHHGVDRRRAAEHPSPWNPDGAAIDMRRRRIVVAPVIDAASERNPFAWIIDFRNADAGRAGLDQQDIGASI